MRKPRTMISHVISFFLSISLLKTKELPVIILFLLFHTLSSYLGNPSSSCFSTTVWVKDMEKRVMMMVMVMVMLIVCMLIERNGVCYCFGEGGDQSPSTVEKAKKTTVKLMTGDAIDRDSSSSSWVNWAREKLAQGFRGKQEESMSSGAAQNIMGSAGNAAIKTKNTISNTASEAAELASENAGPAMNLAFAKAGDAANLASEKAGAVKETMAAADGTDRVMDTVKQAYEEDAGDQTSDSATESMSKEAKIRYESAKEKASQATGDLGAKMRSEL